MAEQGIIFQDYIESYKNTSHLRYEGNLHGDFIYSFQKCKENQFSENNEHDIKNLLDNVIEKIAKDIIANDRKVLTTDLYQKILEISTRSMMEFIQTEMTKGNKIKEEFSKSHIDKVLSEYLIFEDGYWKRKN